MEIKMALGAAQLGMTYGIANKTGLPDELTADAILRTAHDAGVRWIDTAAAYGASEERIGGFRDRNPGSGFEIVTKLAGEVSSESEDEVIRSVEGSRIRLGGPFRALLLHKAEQMHSLRRGLASSLERCRDSGWVREFGVSVYTPDEFKFALGFPELSIIQVPLNVFDQRWLQDGLLAAAESAGKRLLIRSVFLQGLLLMEPDEAERRHPLVVEWLKTWRATCTALNRTPAEVAVGFVRAVAPGAMLILGCETREQVNLNAALVRAQGLSGAGMDAMRAFADVPAAIYDPRLWETFK